MKKLLQDLTRLVDVDDAPPQDVSDLVANATDSGAR
jgi:hypothetical protein